MTSISWTNMTVLSSSTPKCKQTELLHIELTKVYRQQEQTFVDLLNKVRHNDIGPDEEALLQERFAHNSAPTHLMVSSPSPQLQGRHHQHAGAGTAAWRDAHVQRRDHGRVRRQGLPTELDLHSKPAHRSCSLRNDVVNTAVTTNGKLATVQHQRKRDHRGHGKTAAPNCCWKKKSGRTSATS